jgi:hypothetical protein
VGGSSTRASATGRCSGTSFPKALLYDAGFDRAEINAIANFCFLTQDTNLAIGKRRPEDYFAEAEAKHPGALASQWIPTDRSLWRIEAYRDFLAARRELLADAAQSFLTELRNGSATSSAELTPIQVVIDDADDVRAAQIKGLVEELVRLGCAEPALDSEIADPATGHLLGVAEAFWANGLQLGQGSPVVLELVRSPPMRGVCAVSLTRRAVAALGDGKARRKNWQTVDGYSATSGGECLTSADYLAGDHQHDHR